MSQEFMGPLTVTSALGVQGGSLELGATLGAAPDTPYVDFHFGLGAAQDYNVRLINTANNHLDVVTEAGGPVLSLRVDKIGIGTTSPAAKLVVSEPAGGAELRVDGSNGLIGLTLGADAAQPWVGTRTDHDLRLLTNNTEQVRVRANGRVGIGTTGPDTRLNVNSSAPTSQAVLAVSNGNADTRLALWSGFNAGANPPAILYTHDLRFGTVAASNFAAGSGFSEAMRVTSSGNVGIGTTTPKAKLHVIGDFLGAARGSSGEAFRIVVGSTQPGATNWIQYSQNGIYVDIDTSGAGFSSTPYYFTSLGGDSNHWTTQGATSIYFRARTGFRVYVYQPGITVANANTLKWHIQWIGLGN